MVLFVFFFGVVDVLLSFVGEVVLKLNVIIIFCDDLGYVDVGCYGVMKYEMLNIDWFVIEGICFIDFYVMSGVCMLS